MFIFTDNGEHQAARTTDGLAIGDAPLPQPGNNKLSERVAISYFIQRVPSRANRKWEKVSFAMGIVFQPLMRRVILIINCHRKITTGY